MGACPVCGNQYDEHAAFCAACGAPLDDMTALRAPPPPPPPPPPGMAAMPFPVPAPHGMGPASNGLLKSAGIIEIVEGSLLAVIGLWLFAASTSGDTFFEGDSGSGLVLAALFVLAIATALILVGAFTVKGRLGAVITLIVLQSLGVLSGLATLRNGGGASTILVAGVTLALAAFGLHKQRVAR